MDAGGERAGGHHVHRARKAMLREHLTARMEEERQLRARVDDEPLERLLDPRLHHGHLHQATSSAPPTASSSPTARSSSTRTSPTFTAGSATTTSTRSPPPTAQSRPLGASSCMNETAPSPAARADWRALR